MESKSESENGKLMTKDEKAGQKRCPSCKSWDVYPRQLEDGSLGDWCSHCLEFLQKKKLKGCVSKNEVAIDETLKEMVLASTGQRLGNFVIDSLFCIVVYVFVFGIILDLIGLGYSFLSMNEDLQGLIVNLEVLIILLIYYVPQEAFSGRTLGKLITRTKAVNEDGTKLTFGKALGRTLCRFIPFEAFSFLGGQGRPKGWHDRIPKTKVISTRKT